MRFRSIVGDGIRAWVAAALLSAAPLAPAYAVSCTMQAAILPRERDALAAAAGRLATAVAQQDYPALREDLLPSVTADWESMRAVAEQAAPLLKGGQIQLRNLYLLDAASLAAPADTQFFCSNASGSLTVTLTMRALPPGRYAVVLADAQGAPLGGQLGFILAWDGHGAEAAWKLGGLSARQGVFNGHDGVWYWTRARELATADSSHFDAWSAYYSYEIARALLLPVDFLSSPNLEKLDRERERIKNSPHDAFPFDLRDGPRVWKIDSVTLDAALREPDLAVSYESTGVTDPAAARTEAVAVFSALLKAQPGLRENFHGLWAYAVKDGKREPVLEMPMAQIP
jgi:hypothetical protein